MNNLIGYTKTIESLVSYSIDARIKLIRDHLHDLHIACKFASGKQKKLLKDELEKASRLERLLAD